MNGRGRKPRLTLPPCPRCGMDSGRRVVSDTAHELNFVICDSCGFRTKGYSDMAHATRSWAHGKHD